MKKCFLILISGLLFSSINLFSQTSDSTVNQLLRLDSSYYSNKPLDSIIADLPAGYLEMKIRGIRGTARFITVLYPNRVWIELHVRQFSHMNPYNRNRNWDINEMRKESLYLISVKKGAECYRGCPEY